MKLNEDTIRREMLSFIQSNALMIAETQRIWNNKIDITEYEKGRKDGIIIVGMDTQDNLLRLCERIGLNLRKKEKSQLSQDKIKEDNRGKEE